MLRGVPPKRLFASFLHEEKGRGRAFDLLFSKIAIFLRGHTDKPFFQVWPEGHLLSSHEERRQRRAKGLPLGAPGNFVDFLFRKIDLNAATLSIDIKKGGGPGLGVAVFFRPRTQSNPGGPGPPCCMGVGLGDSVPVDFHEEKIGTFSGSPGAKLPAAFLLPFVATS